MTDPVVPEKNKLPAAGGGKGRVPVLYLADASCLSLPQLSAAALAAVGEERREIALRCRRSGERELSLAAGLLLRAGLAEAGETFPERFPKNAHGKPYISGNGIRFSLSHSGRFAVCAVAECEVGCDVQETEKCRPESADRWFSPSEKEALAKVAPDGKKEFFCRVFTLKESFVKALGTGMSLPFPTFSALPGTGRVTGRAEAADTFTYEWDVIPGYRLALCTLGETPAPELRRVDLAALLRSEGKI